MTSLRTPAVPLLLAACMGFSPPLRAADAPDPHERVLPMKEFVTLAAERDTEFEAILLDELKLKYRAALALPPGDLILSAKQDLEIFLDQNRTDGATEVGLSRLFPHHGTQLDASYEATPSFSEDSASSELSLSLTQPIARNAFGRSTRLLEKIVGLETAVARHQIVEAYEDYLATIMLAYHGWFEAFENLSIARSSYRENLKLLDNIRERAKQQVARPVDVNKIELQVLAKKERVIEFEEDYERAFGVIKRVVRHDEKTRLVPSRPPALEIAESADRVLAELLQSGRTFTILRLLEDASTLEVDREADDLLPSLSLLVQYDVRGEDRALSPRDDRLAVGLSVEWPFPDATEEAEHEVARIELDETRLRRINTRYRLDQEIRDLFVELRKEKKIMQVIQEKITLAQRILEDETENYSFGRVTLNDYISAVNVLDNNRFSQVLHEARYRKLATEWLRMTDRLVNATNNPIAEDAD